MAIGDRDTDFFYDDCDDDDDADVAGYGNDDCDVYGDVDGDVQRVHNAMPG